MAFFVVLVFIIGVAVLAIRVMSGKGRSGGPGVGATGAIHDMLNEDRRKAIEIILEERAGYRDPETADDQPSAERPDPHRRAR